MDEAAADRDASLLLGMLLAARDAQSFLRGLKKDTFMASRLHQNAINRSLEVIGEVAGKDFCSCREACIRTSRGGNWNAFNSHWQRQSCTRGG
jgi:uncharacterized protein with HEPN domain